MQATDVKFYRSKAITDSAENGGHIDLNAEIISGVKFNLFPRVSSFERTNGAVRYRKAYMANRSTGNVPLFDVAIALTVPSKGGDRFYIKPATSHAQTAEQLDENGWTGGGRLNAPITAGDSSLQILFEHNDFEIAEGSLVLVKNEAGKMFTSSVVGNASWSGNVATVALGSQAPENFATTDTCAGICVKLGDIGAAYENVEVTSSAGVFDSLSLLVNNLGTVEDDWTITFVSPSAFNVSGAVTGNLPAGSISSYYQAMNPSAGDFYFSISFMPWGGSWQVGDTLTFSTRAASKGFWLKEVIPAGTEREADNSIRLDWIAD